MKFNVFRIERRISIRIFEYVTRSVTSFYATQFVTPFRNSRILNLMETEDLYNIRIGTLVINQRNNTEIIPSFIFRPINGKNIEFQKLDLQNSFCTLTNKPRCTVLNVVMLVSLYYSFFELSCSKQDFASCTPWRVKCNLETQSSMQKSEASFEDVPQKKVFWKISQNLQENTCIRDSFFNKVAEHLRWLLLKNGRNSKYSE